MKIFNYIILVVNFNKINYRLDIANNYDFKLTANNLASNLIYRFK